MEENKDINTKEHNSVNGTVIRIPGDIVDKLENISEYFSYDSLPIAAKNAIKIGFHYFEQSPEEFRKLLNSIKN